MIIILINKLCFYFYLLALFTEPPPPSYVHICLYSTIFVKSFLLHLQVDFLLRSLISLVVVPDGYCCVSLAVQDTSCKIVTCLIMYLPCSRDIHIFSDVSACTVIYFLAYFYAHLFCSVCVQCLFYIFGIITQLATHGYAFYFSREFIYLRYQRLNI